MCELQADSILFSFTEIFRAIRRQTFKDIVDLLLNSVAHFVFMNVNLSAFVCKDDFRKGRLHFVDSLHGQVPGLRIVGENEQVNVRVMGGIVHAGVPVKLRDRNVGRFCYDVDLLHHKIAPRLLLIVSEHVGIFAPEGNHMRPDVPLTVSNFFLCLFDVDIRRGRKKAVFSDTVDTGTLADIFNKICGLSIIDGVA